jgi:hypothetical protein
MTWINKNTLYLACKLRFQRLQRQQIIAKNQPIIKAVIFCHSMGGMVRLFGIFQQNARLQLRPMLFANPSQF